MNQPSQTRMSRRRFLAGAAVVAGTFPSLPATAAVARSAFESRLPPPSRSGIDHVVVVMMENRSFDHFLGWLPRADGRQAGLSYTDKAGIAHATYPLAPDFAGCGYRDPDHSYDGGRVQYDNGACDGFLRSGQSDVFAIGYYTRRDLPFLGEAARRWTVCDRYFAAFMGPTVPNRLYQHAGVTDRIANPAALTDLPTIWDRLAGRRLRGAYYYSNLSFLSYWGDRYDAISHPHSRFLADCRSGKLPHVAFVDPFFSDSVTGDGNDDHPRADIRAGESFLNEIYKAVTSSPAWRRTLLVINFDEWGGFFDHVPPTTARDVDPAYELRGFRVPCLLISPFARRGHVAHGIYDHTSVLRLIEWRWKLEPLSVRDAHARNLANALDFSRRDLKAPRFAVPRVPPTPACPVPQASSEARESGLPAFATRARAKGSATPFPG
jgi:phospholipase C